MFILRKLIDSEFKGFVTAIARFDDKRQELLEAGTGAVYNISAEAGTGYGDYVCQSIGGILQMRIEILTSISGVEFDSCHQRKWIH